MFDKTFPRKLTEIELELLFKILPYNNPGYYAYRSLLKNYYLAGQAGSDDSYLLAAGEVPSGYDPYLTPVFASGIFTYNEILADAIIHEDDGGFIIIDISISKAQKDKPDVIYSDWVPGNKAPGDNSEVRTVKIVPGKYVLAAAPVHSRLWLYNYDTGVNHFLSSGQFYNSLCIIKNIRDAAIVLNPKLLFRNLANYTDNELISAFYLYNKTLGKFRIEAPVSSVPDPKKNFLQKFLKKDKS